jgi:hypothetical protein
MKCSQVAKIATEKNLSKLTEHEHYSASQHDSS